MGNFVPGRLEHEEGDVLVGQLGLLHQKHIRLGARQPLLDRLESGLE
jgi:hypothetical protein